MEYLLNLLEKLLQMDHALECHYNLCIAGVLLQGVLHELGTLYMAVRKHSVYVLYGTVVFFMFAL